MSNSKSWAEAALVSVEAAWAKAALTWDVEGLSSLYAEDALFYGALPGHSVGRVKVREYFSAYAGSVVAAKFKLSDQTITVLAPEIVLAQGLGRFEITMADGVRRTLEMRTTWILVRRANAWRILQHHFSPPPTSPPVPLPPVPLSS